MLYPEYYLSYLLIQLTKMFTQCQLCINMFSPLGGAMAGIHLNFYVQSPQPIYLNNGLTKCSETLHTHYQYNYAYFDRAISYFGVYRFFK